MEFEQIIENVQKLSAEQLEEVKLIVEKELSEKQMQEIENVLQEAKKAVSENKLKYYSSGEEFLSALNED